MKIYKLKKWYPSLPNDWKAGMLVGLGNRCASSSFSPCHGKYTDYYESYKNVINNPEFWEEVIEKDYEILSFKRNGNFFSTEQQKLATLQKDGSYLHMRLLSTTGGSSLEFMLKNKFYDIHSVKRLSDGEIFTVGDIVNRPCYKKPFKIKHFHIQNCKPPTIWLHSMDFVEGNCTHTLDENCTLEKAIKFKKPLFTTEEGVDIYEGDNYYGVTNEFKIFYNNSYMFSTNDLKNDNKRFSTKKAAEEYILMNKPCLNIKDILPTIGLWNNTTYVDLNLITKKLKELVKSKL
jgi:hypothetical protein